MACFCGCNAPDVDVTITKPLPEKKPAHPNRGCEYSVKARWWRKGLLSACVWCGKLASCAPSGYGSGGYHWEKLK